MWEIERKVQEGKKGPLLNFLRIKWHFIWDDVYRLPFKFHNTPLSNKCQEVRERRNKNEKSNYNSK